MVDDGTGHQVAVPDGRFHDREYAGMMSVTREMAVILNQARCRCAAPLALSARSAWSAVGRQKLAVRSMAAVTLSSTGQILNQITGVRAPVSAVSAARAISSADTAR
jgi:hypothetical protein